MRYHQENTVLLSKLLSAFSTMLDEDGASALSIQRTSQLSSMLPHIRRLRHSLASYLESIFDIQSAHSCFVT